MLKPLAAAFGQWTPQKRERWTSDPLSLLAAGWSEIVGDDVARNTHPTRILDDTLLDHDALERVEPTAQFSRRSHLERRPRAACRIPAWSGCGLG